MVKITFLGAAGTVTGSKYLVEHGKTCLMVDAGLFQGERQWRDRNWSNPQFKLENVQAVLLTHAHIDHCGILPRFVAQGLNCPVYCTRATQALCGLLLPDSAHLQEEEAEYRLTRGRSRHHPPLALYTVKDAELALTKFRGVPFEKRQKIIEGVEAEWHHAGHILGAAYIKLWIGGKLITFSGDIGRYTVPIMKDPQPPEFGDLLLVESTYGDRLHQDLNPKEKLADVINRTVQRRGIVVIPAFAVGRTQLLLYYLRQLKTDRKIPDLPIIIDSPMARDATTLYANFPGDYDEEALGILKAGLHPFSTSKLGFVQNRTESIKLNSITDPMIIISASGMLSGGRILHHLKHRISSPLNTILFVGHQPKGGRGDWILNGASSLRILGEEVTIRAEIAEISGLSAHGDKAELLRWCNEGQGKPGKVAVVHGEPEAAKHFCDTLRTDLKWDAWTPRYLEELEL